MAYNGANLLLRDADSRVICTLARMAERYEFLNGIPRRMIRGKTEVRS